MKTMTIILATGLILNSCIDKKMINQSNETVNSNNASVPELIAKGNTNVIYKKKYSKNGLIIVKSIANHY